jgi:hypothetical protein
MPPTITMRIAAMLMVASVLASCSGSGRVGHIVPEWAGGSPQSTPPRAAAPRHDAPDARSDGGAQAGTQPQTQPDVSSYPE